MKNELCEISIRMKQYSFEMERFESELRENKVSTFQLHGEVRHCHWRLPQPALQGSRQSGVDSVRLHLLHQVLETIACFVHAGK